MPNSTAFQPRSLLLYVGFVLLGLGVFITATLWFLFIFGAPLALLGLVLILVSGQPAWRMGLAILLPFAAWVGIAAGAWATAPREPGITYLIPEGYEGPVLVVRNEPCAPATEREHGRTLYRIPASGLLIVRDSVPNRQHPYYDWPHKGYFLRPDNQYFVVDRQGRRLRQLMEVQRTTEPDSDPESTTLLFGRVGKDELAAFYESPIESAPDSNGVGYTFQYVAITTQNRYDTPAYYASEQRVRALADSLVPRCRVRSGLPPQGLRKPRPNSFAAPADSAAR